MRGHRRTKRPVCKKTGKAIFRDELSTKIELSRILKRDDPKREKIPNRAYLCEFCRMYHLTSQPERMRK